MVQTLGAYPTNEAAKPLTVNEHGLVSAPVITLQGTIEAPVTAAADTIILCAIPTDARLLEVSLAFDDLETNAVAPDSTMHIGLFTKNVNTGVFTAVDNDAFAVSVDVFTAAIPLTNYRFSALNIDTATQPTWDLATGLTARPAYDRMYLGLTTAVSTLGTVVGTVSFRVLYTF